MKLRIGQKSFLLSTDENSESWSWICPNCVKDTNIQLIGKAVRVWWHDDAVAYQGQLNAVDEVTGKYRVLYDDDEWEFISLAKEPLLVKENGNGNEQIEAPQDEIELLERITSKKVPNHKKKTKK